MSVKQIVLTIILTLSLAASTNALPPFRKPLDDRYAKNDEGLRRELRRVNCNLCHVKDKEKQFVNAYGKLLADLLPGNAEDRLNAAAALGKAERDAEFINVMRELKEAVKQADARRNRETVTYGELFRSRKLPAGDVTYTLRDN